MNYKISKELFEAVSEHKVDEIKVVDVYIQIYKGTAMIRVSIYEFFFKCKEWLIGRGYDNWSGYHETEYFCFIITKGAFISTSEQQAVFDVCQWILDKDKQ